MPARSWSSSGAADPWIRVRGNHLVDGDGQPVRLLGVNRPGTECQCVEGGEHLRKLRAAEDR